MDQWADKNKIFSLTASQERREIVGVGCVWIRGLSLGEKDIYESDAYRFGKTGEIRLNNARALLLMRTIYDQHGKRLFAESDMGRIQGLPSLIFEPLYETARRLSGFRVAEIEELAKNSVTTGSDDSVIV